MHLKISVIACLVLLLLALPGWGQTSIYLGGGPSLYVQSTPHWAGNLLVGPVIESTGTSILTVFEARGSHPQSLTYSTMELIRQSVISKATKYAIFELAGLAGGGAVVTTTATGGSVAMGGELSVHPASAPNWDFSLSARAVYAPVTAPEVNQSPWGPWLMFHVGYTWRR